MTRNTRRKLNRFLDRSFIVPALCISTLLAIASSNMPAGMIFRASLILPLHAAGLISEPHAMSFALHGNLYALPAPFGINSATLR
jgi:hypothetical protein